MGKAKAPLPAIFHTVHCEQTTATLWYVCSCGSRHKTWSAYTDHVIKFLRAEVAELMEKRDRHG